MGDQLTRNMVVKDPGFDSLALDQDRYGEEFAAVSKAADASSDDIGAFRKRGGKLLIMHGTVDMAVSLITRWPITNA